MVNMNVFFEFFDIAEFCKALMERKDQAIRTNQYFSESDPSFFLQFRWCNFAPLLLRRHTKAENTLRYITHLNLTPSNFCVIRFEYIAQSSEQHYNDVIMSTIASQITSLTIVYSTVYSGADQRKHQSSASLAFVRGIHRGPVNSPHKGPVTRKMFPFDDVIVNFISSQIITRDTQSIPLIKRCRQRSVKAYDA